MDGLVMFGDIVAIVSFARSPVVVELTVVYSASEPVVFHVHQL